MLPSEAPFSVKGNRFDEQLDGEVRQVPRRVEAVKVGAKEYLGGPQMPAPVRKQVYGFVALTVVIDLRSQSTLLHSHAVHCRLTSDFDRPPVSRSPRPILPPRYGPQPCRARPRHPSGATVWRFPLQTISCGTSPHPQRKRAWVLKPSQNARGKGRSLLPLLLSW